MKASCGEIEVAWFEVGWGKPLVLIHGLADDHRAWRHVLPWLAMRNRVILYDLRGHGQTTTGTPRGTLKQLAEDLVALMDAIALPSARIAGFSLGGTIAMRIAIDHPERVEALYAVATSSRVGKAAAAWYSERARLVAKEPERLRITLDEDTREVYRNAPAELEAGLAIRRQSTADPRGYGSACRAMAALSSEPLDPELASIKAPTLVVSSDLDQHCPPRAGEIIASGIAGARLEIISGSGHPIPVERPAQLGALLA